MNRKPFIPRNQNTVLANTELTEKIIKACYEVANELGSGFLESVYLNALLVVLRQMELKAIPQFRIKVEFRGEFVGEFIADILVEGKAIVEVKSVSSLAPEHSAQVINYLKATDMETGLLINFGRPRIEIRHLYHPRLNKLDIRMQGQKIRKVTET